MPKFLIRYDSKLERTLITSPDPIKAYRKATKKVQNIPPVESVYFIMDGFQVSVYDTESKERVAQIMEV